MLTILTLSVCDHRVGGLAGQTAAHAVDGEDAEAVGGEWQQPRDVEGGPVVGDDDFAFQIPRTTWIVAPVKIVSWISILITQLSMWVI